MKTTDKDLSPHNLLMQKAGEKFLEESKAKGPNYDRLGTSFVMRYKKPQALSQETESLISPSRQFRKLRIDIIKERSELRDLISKGRVNSTK